MGGLLQAARQFAGRAFGAGPAGEPSPSPDDKYLKKTQDCWNDLKNAYIVYHQSIWQALLFYANQSWIDWDDARKVWQPQQPTDEWVPRPRINRFSPTVDAVASNFFRLPEVEAAPKPDDDPMANMVAQVATQLADDWLTKSGLRFQQGQEMDKGGLAAQLFVLCGGVFTILRKEKRSLGQQPVKQTVSAWGVKCSQCDTYTRVPKQGSQPPPGEPQDRIQEDLGGPRIGGGPGASAEEVPPTLCPTCGSPLDVEDTELVRPQLDEQGQPLKQEATEWTIQCDIGNTLYAFPRPGSISVADSPYLLWAERAPTDTSWFRWGFDAQPDAIWPDGYSVTYEHALNFWYTGYSSTTIQVKDSSMVLQLWVAPNKIKDIPEGCYAVVINDKLAFSEPWDFPEHPCTLGHYLTLPTIFFPRSVAFDLVEIQRELNAYESIIKLHGMTTASDPWVIDANTIVSEITGRSDKIIKWRPVGPNSEPPHRAGSGHLDDGVYKQRDNLHAEFQNISMAVNAFRGEQEGAITAAAAIQQLRSQAELMFSKPAANWNNLWRETVRKAVKFMQRYYTFEQLMRVCGPDRENEVRAFMAADLDASTTWVATTHGLPRTRDEKRQEMMVLWDKKALDINDPAVRQKMYELFGETGAMRSFNRDATRARLENQAMRGGRPITPMPEIEDMPVHLYFHRDQAKSLDFDKWDPAAKQLLIQHIIATEQAMMMKMQQAAMMAQAAQGKPAGKPPGGGPESAARGAEGAAASPGQAGAPGAMGGPPPGGGWV